ncbi:hypothetical protein GMOD_00001456 [Pyrenophora seminiperda CCB06]|uniref:Uncharacterized protein n=1 Tax=Pyrenophora seminiperda CCB06 TaxID=1302712 RepID=A0A3M7LZ90_9PLEO|nr:hypothetical protein GMOD_00001456 [Pyrenophora seminiperda CCB06]
MAPSKASEIPKGMSAPADPAAPSILTTFPPELRNSVYKQLFPAYGLIMLHDSTAYRCALIATHSKNPHLRGALDDDLWSMGASEREELFECEFQTASQVEIGKLTS